MKKTMRNSILASAAMLLALPVIASAADGIIGDCVDCHTMHNSEQGAQVAQHGSAGTVGGPIQNLLRMDCIACHANPAATSATWAYGDSTIPQVSWDNQTGDGTNDLAGGNFKYSTDDERNGHNVIDITAATTSDLHDQPPGIYGTHYHGHGVFTVDAPFDAFTCAGARGCHGTRAQLLSGVTVDNGTANNFEGVRRTGIAAISGAHHNSYDGVKNDTTGYGGTEAVHDGAVVADGYRFIPGLVSAGNLTDRWMNIDENSHNEYAANAQTPTAYGTTTSGCGRCHTTGHGIDTDGDTVVDDGYGFSSRAAANSYINVPNNTISGFCATCHLDFHSSGTENGTSGAFLRHPSDWVIPEAGEYAAYDVYDVSAPVARPISEFTAAATGGSIATASDVVRGGTDMVMCLSCHKAHASENDYMLRFDYGVMTAGDYADIPTAVAEGGCLACHTTKGVLPENR
jgi:hypothetical protein